MMLVERPGYRIDSLTIKRGSRPSILIVSFVESSNLCILASLQSSSLVLIWILSWYGFGACRARHDKAKVTENGFHLRLLLRFRYWRFCRFIRTEGFSLPFICKISFNCFNNFQGLHVSSSFHQNWFYFFRTLFAKRYCISGLQMRRFTFLHLVLSSHDGLRCFST